MPILNIFARFVLSTHRDIEIMKSIAQCISAKKHYRTRNKWQTYYYNCIIKVNRKQSDGQTTDIILYMYWNGQARIKKEIGAISTNMKRTKILNLYFHQRTHRLDSRCHLLVVPLFFFPLQFPSSCGLLHDTHLHTQHIVDLLRTRASKIDIEQTRDERSCKRLIAFWQCFYHQSE